MSDKKKLILLGVLIVALVAGFILTSPDNTPPPPPRPAPTPAASSLPNEDEKSVVGVQEEHAEPQIVEKIIIKDPDVLTIEDLPTLSLRDRTYLRNLVEEEQKRHELAMAKIEAELTKAQAETAQNRVESGDLTGLTGGSVPASLAGTGVQMAQTVETTTPVEDSPPEITPDMVFRGINVRSMASSVDGAPSVWLSVDGGLMTAVRGKSFGTFIVEDITDSSIIIHHTPTGFMRSIGLNAVQFNPRSVEPTPEPSIIPNSVEEVRANNASARG
ncbi:hypothetical protein [Vibrio agarivorans]|uniref:Type IV pilus biogenesis protein PilP n=1 Tax=Vibrio agarivorans TaxID=153622 RepID=A0ABT7Y7E9_9VIBR|nr:hypothetical protein [Vibrio agarivorans]MDN2483968.1 hypothetical protein [Vibrio agarivorans]